MVTAIFDVRSFKDTGAPTLSVLIVHGVFLYNTILLAVNLLIDATDNDTPSPRHRQNCNDKAAPALGSLLNLYSR